MNRAALQVARWEFSRFFKIKEIVVTLISCHVMAAGYVGVRWLIEWGDEGPPQVAILLQADETAVGGAVGSPIPAEMLDGIALVDSADRDEAAMRQDVEEGTIDGLLVIHRWRTADLYVTRTPHWLDGLRPVLNQTATADRLIRSGLTPETLQQAAEPLEVTVHLQDTGENEAASTEEQFLAGGITALMLLGLMVGNGTLFIAITGEKQNRVTEQVVACVSPQTWIDGKILGLSGIAVVSMTSLGLGGASSYGLMRLLGEDFPIPLDFLPLGLLAVLAPIAICGFLMWFAFFAGVAATIDDPNTSARSVLMMAPMLPLAFVFNAFQSPDTVFMRTLSLIPLTSPTILPIRYVLGDVVWWEYVVAIGLLMGATFLVRRAAGRIFALGILMYGKEPSLREMWRCARTG